MTRLFTGNHLSEMPISARYGQNRRETIETRTGAIAPVAPLPLHHCVLVCLASYTAIEF